LLKKGRGLRKRTKGGPEEAETPAEGSDLSGANGSAAVVAAEVAEPEPPPPEVDENPAGESPDLGGTAVDAVEIIEVLETVEAGEVVEAVEAGAVEAIDDDEPPLPPTRALPVPEGPVLETAMLPDVSAEPTTSNPLTIPRVVAIANQKGGVGKTTTTVNLGASLAELGFRVLVLDLDPQGNATTGLGLNPRDVEGSVYDVLLNDVALEDIIEPTSLKNLFVAPATIDLAGAEIELVPVMSRELKLRKAVDQVRDQYDLVLIDCPPSLGLLTVNGLAASDDVLVPIQCEYYALEGLGQLLRNVGLVQANLNPGLDIRGIILTMYDARTKLADQVVSEVRAYFGEKVYETVVPRTVRLSEAPSFGQPIIVFDSTSRGAKAYRDLAKEVSRGATGRAG
jgi:chromosome partitioning protein